MMFWLSDEIACQIFSYLVPSLPWPEPWGDVISEQGHYYQLEHCDDTDFPDLLNILRVCRHWRAIALSCSTLWTNLKAVRFNSASFHFMLRFARNAPLVWPPLGSDGHGTIANTLSLVLNHLSHIGDMHLEIGTADTLQLTERLFTANAVPAMESLWLEASDRHKALIKVDAPALPPRLKRLYICDIRLSLASTVPPTNITLFRTRSLPPLLEADSLFDTLAKMPNLTFLSLDWNSWNVPRVKTRARSPPIHLAHLQYFEFLGTPAQYAYVLPSLSLSNFARLRLDLHDDTILHHHDTSLGTSVEPLESRLHDFLDCFGKSVRKCLEFWKGQLSTYGLHFQVQDGTMGPSDPDPTVFSEIEMFEGSGDGKLSIVPALSDGIYDDIELPDNLLAISFPMEKVDLFDGPLPFFSLVSNIFPPDFVDTIILRSDFALSDPITGISRWSPSFLRWTGVKSFRVQGAHATAWLLPHLKSHQTGAGESMSMSVFECLENLILENLESGFCKCPESYLLQLRAEVEDVIRLRSETKHQKLKKFELWECDSRLFRTWLYRIKADNWVEGIDWYDPMNESEDSIPEDIV